MTAGDETAGAVDDALAAVKARWDHGDAPYDPDVLALIRAAETMRAKFYGPTGDDPMPVFVLKGRDALAPGVIDAYRRECDRHDLGEQAQQVLLAFEEMAAWQRRNWTLVKLPDHPHTPVA